MIISAPDIRKMLADGSIVVEPTPVDADIRSVGLRVHLGDELLVPEAGQVADLAGGGPELKFASVHLAADGYRLPSGGFVLAAMRERLQAPCDVVCHLEGRSTIARIGLTVHVTSGIIDGNTCQLKPVTLELANLGPFEVVLRPGVAVGMITFSRLTSPVEPNVGAYGKANVEPPRL